MILIMTIMCKIMNFFNNWGTTILLCIITILMICSFICNLSLALSHFGLLIAIPGVIGSTLSLSLCIFLLIEEIKDARH